MAVPSTEKHLTRLVCCRPDRDDLGCRKTREALGRLTSDAGLRETFGAQIAFDEPLSTRIRALPLPPEFRSAIDTGLRRAAKPAADNWRGLLRQPALWAVLLAGAFLLAWGGWALYAHLAGFPGDENVRQLVESSLSTNQPPVQQLQTECGKLGDTLFLLHNLEDFDVPTPFTREMASGYRVFERNNSPVTQVQAQDTSLSFLVFRADAQGVDITPPGTWKYLDGDGWIAAAEVRNHICFVAISRGDRAAIDSRLRVAQN